MTTAMMATARSPSRASMRTLPPAKPEFEHPFPIGSVEEAATGHGRPGRVPWVTVNYAGTANGGRDGGDHEAQGAGPVPGRASGDGHAGVGRRRLRDESCGDDRLAPP